MFKARFYIQIIVIFLTTFLIQKNIFSQDKTLENNGTSFSYRLTLDLKTPRRYATRFNKETRTLQIKITPASAKEVENLSYYDSRFIQRVVVQENNSEIVLNIQLKNFPMGWLVAAQEGPWRLLVDFWKTEDEKNNLSEKWDWQPNILSGVVADNAEKGSQARPILNASSNKQTPIATKVTEKNIPIVQPKITKINSQALSKNLVNKKYDLPDIYSRFELIKPLSDVKKAQMEMQIGTVFGSPNEFSAARLLAQELFASGQEEKALPIFRKLAALNETKFKQDDKLLWQAGESAFLLKNFDIAHDYFRTLLVNHPGSPFVPNAQLRITDIDELTHSDKQDRTNFGPKNSEAYAKLALSDKNPSNIKIAATLRVLEGVVDKNPSAVKIYQQNLDTCVTSGLVTFDLLKNCAYDRVRYLADNDNITNADIAVQKFKALAPLDNRGQNLENIVVGRVKTLLEEVSKNKNWNSWVEFEKKARPALLAFTFENGDFVFTRANAFEAVGENKKAIQLYTTYLKIAKDNKLKNEAASQAALLLYKMNDTQSANDLLKRIAKDETRKTEGLTDKSVAALKELSLLPYKNKVALNILMDEIKLGRYEERTLSVLAQWCELLRGQAQAEQLYEKILAYPSKSAEETQLIESSILHFADDLRESARFSKSGDMYFAIANLSQGSRRAESAYKAGVVYARAGLFEKAKAAWLLAANDTNDKRYSELANERLDRLNK